MNSEGKNLVVHSHTVQILNSHGANLKGGNENLVTCTKVDEQSGFSTKKSSLGESFYCIFVLLERFSWQIVLLRVLEGALVVVRTSFEEHSTSLFERGGLLFVFEGLFLYV